MIPLRLQEGLKNRMIKVFANLQYKQPAEGSEEDPYSSVNVYTQRLPVKEDKYDSPFPFILVKLMEGNQANMIDSNHIVHVSFIVGMYNRDKDNQGDQDVSLALNKIIETLSKDPTIDGVFDLNMDAEINWTISDEDTAPFFFGAVSAYFNAPKIQRQDLAVGGYL